MKCFDEKTYLFFLDGELSKQKKSRVTRHLEKCQYCRGLVRKLQEENTEISNLFELDHRIPDPSQLVLKRIGAGDTPDTGKRRILFPDLLRGLRIAAVVVFIAILSVFIFVKKESTAPDSSREILVQTANVDGHAVQTHIFSSGDDDITFIWLEKI